LDRRLGDSCIVHQEVPASEGGHRAIVEYVVELVGFPGTKYDDQVDSTTQALDHMREDDVLATYLKAFGR
jgi:hypothetical protein